MSARTIGVMGRVLDPGHGLGLYCISLLRNMLVLDPGSRYVIWMRTSEHSDLFSDFPNVETQILPGRGNLWWDQVVRSGRGAPRWRRSHIQPEVLDSVRDSTPVRVRAAGFRLVSESAELSVVGQHLHPPAAAALLPQGPPPDRDLAVHP